MTEPSIPLDILDDLSSRFIINVPEEERKDLVRICFQIELAHWFYLDFYCMEDSRKLKKCSVKEFATHIFHHIPFLKPHVPHIDSVLGQWRGYKQSVPTYGAIVLNEDMTKVLLVQGYLAKHSWGFPKGKVNEDEDPSHCAVREVLEETGFDISHLIDKNEYIESTIRDQLIRLYIISGVQMSTKFKPRTRKEIKSVEWFALADLPHKKKDMTSKVKSAKVGPNAFFMVIPFVKRMKQWIAEKQQCEKHVAKPQRHRHKSMGDIESTSDSKRQQQFLSHSVQNENMDVKMVPRRLNTSPARKRAFEAKSSQKTGLDCKTVQKGAFKRNLFGEFDEDQSTTVLAKQLVDSPRVGQPSILHPKAVQPNKSTEFNRQSENVLTSKDNDVLTNEQVAQELASGNIKSLLFGDAAQKLSLEIKDIPSPFGGLQHGNQSPFVRQRHPNTQDLSLEFNSKIWTHFKFDRQAVLNCF